jgi:F0F1-type ATP synthase membrane subunit b/b'
MPQFDISGFSTQLLWLTFVFGVLYIIVSNFIAPKAESILINRNLYLEDNIASSENDHNKALSLQKQKEEKLRELDIAIEEMQKDALNKLDAYFTKKNTQLESSLATKTQKAFAEIQNYLHSFHENEDQSCIDLAAFIIENITDKSANIELLKKIYGTK